MSYSKGQKQSIVPTQLSAPPVSSSSMNLDPDGDTAPSTAKRTRKVVNCEPCRTNKLKCDRNRPCSSCELRGTTYQCYRDTGPFDTVANQGLPIDPLAEVRKIRTSINSIEQSIRYTQSQGTEGVVKSNQYLPPGSPGMSNLNVDKTLTTHIFDDGRGITTTPGSGPGAHGRQVGGFYTGPTSASSHLISLDGEDIDPLPASVSSLDAYTHADILSALPEPDLIEQIIEYHFIYCRWTTRIVWEKSFRDHWAEYKTHGTRDSLVLATCCGILALTMVFIPNQHPLKLATVRQLGPRPHEKLFHTLQTIQDRYEKGHGSSAYSLEYAELLLIRGHYYLYAVQAGEEIWAAGSRAINVATAMGLHRDPSQWKMPAEVAERRRWLWWGILTWCRWQSMLIGRPPLIAAHHCDTQLPLGGLDLMSTPDVEVCDAPRRQFMLSKIVNAITDDALSLRPVPYSHIRRYDMALGRWKSDLPSGFEMDRAKIISGVCSEDMAVRRRIVQCIHLLSSYYHIRFTLHRPYASRLPNAVNNIGETKLESAESAGIAATSAENLINLMIWCQGAFHLPPERACSTTGYLAYISFYLFTAAMFFSFQLIASPKGTRAKQYRSNIDAARKALHDLTPDMPGGRLAPHAIKILDTLEPLWKENFVHMPNGPDKEELKTRILASVRRLAFPFHDPGAGRTATASNDPPAMANGLPESEIGSGSASDTTTSAHAVQVPFGTYGTLMPDMSMSGQIPAAQPETRERHMPHQTPEGIGYNPLSQYTPEPDWATAKAPDAQPAVYDPALMSQHLQQDHSVMQLVPPTPASTGTWMPAAPSDYFSHRQHQQPPQASLSSQQDAWVQAYGTPTSVGIGYHNPVRSISQEMSWGASVGIEAGEWAGFTLSMTDTAYPNERL